MIVWGGLDGTGIQALDSGGTYDPSTDTWRPITATNAPSARHQHTAVWTGTEMIVWGGVDGNTGDSEVLSSGAKYNPSTDTWTPIENAPAPRQQHAAVWTGDEMIVWGGRDGSTAPVTFPDEALLYEPASNSWSPTTGVGAPAGRGGPSGVWTGAEMIVWGGESAIRVDTGGRYGPSPDVWTATSVSGAPLGRVNHSAVWTGTEMIIWGGLKGDYLDSGGRYDPLDESWDATPTEGAPSGRHFHTAVWTGTEMIVWGGQNPDDSLNVLNTGARYVP